jgi:hypothetical protein
MRSICTHFVRGTKVASSAADNGRLSAWQREHLLLTSCVKRTTVGEIEGELIAQLTPPLTPPATLRMPSTQQCVLRGPSSGDERVPPLDFTKPSHRLSSS